LELILDVSELAAPEPLLRAVDALQALPRGDYLRFRHRMKPCHLYAMLEKNGLAWDTRRGEVVECELFIWHAGDEDAEAAARRVAETLSPWQD
jgi:hypothetical protein